MNSEEYIKTSIQSIPLHERLQKSESMIALMCSQLRPPKMRIPVQWSDEDFYIIQTLKDAQTRLTLTEAALSAAGELLSMSSMGDVYSDDGGYIYCSSCYKMYPHHKQTCEYHRAKARYHAARDALNGMTK